MACKNLYGFILISALSVLLAGSAQAQKKCVRWSVGGDWSMTQGGYQIFLRLRQDKINVNGEAMYTNKNRTTRGSVSGTVKQNVFKVEIVWSPNSTGAYYGEISKNGRISGVTGDLKAPVKNAGWSSNQSMPCAAYGEK